MPPLILLAVIVGVPILLGVLLRVSSVLLFFSIMCGELLVRYIAGDVLFSLETFTHGRYLAVAVNFALLSLPVALTVYFLKKTMPSSMFLLHILPIIGAGVVFAIFALPLLTPSLQNQIYGTSIGSIFRQSQDIAVTVAVLLNMLLAWRMYRNRPHHDKKHK